MTKRLVIAIGDYGAGKTAFCKWYAKRNEGLFIDFELLYFENQENEIDSYDTFVKRLTSTMQKSSKRLFVIDGYKAITGGYDQLADPTFVYLQDKLRCDIRLCLCFAAPHVVRKRQEVKASHVSEPLPREEIEIKRITHSLYDLAVLTDSDPLFVDTTDDFHFVSKEEWPQRWEELTFLSDLDKKTHDKYYQDIELPSGLVIPGYSQSHETWNRLSQLVDFKDKDVLDVGCFHGYICFKAEEAGARSITGIDISEDAIEVVRRVAWLRKSRARFNQGDLVNLQIDHIYDTVFALNMLHHVKDIDKALQNLFMSGKTIVLEIQLEQEEVVAQYAQQFNFQFIGKANSHRTDREIVVFANPQAKVPPLRIPRDYQYNYGVEYRKKLIRRTIGLALKMKVFYPLVWLVRRYRHFRKSDVRPLVSYIDTTDRET